MTRNTASTKLIETQYWTQQI